MAPAIHLDEFLFNQAQKRLSTPIRILASPPFAPGPTTNLPAGSELLRPLLQKIDDFLFVSVHRNQDAWFEGIRPQKFRGCCLVFPHGPRAKSSKPVRARDNRPTSSFLRLALPGPERCNPSRWADDKLNGAATPDAQHRRRSK